MVNQKPFGTIIPQQSIPSDILGEVLGSVGFKEIASELKKSDVILAKKQLPAEFNSLNKLGEHVVPLKLGSGLVSRLKIIIS